MRLALVAGPPSPEKPDVPFPATVLIVAFVFDETLAGMTFEVEAMTFEVRARSGSAAGWMSLIATGGLVKLGRRMPRNETWTSGAELSRVREAAARVADGYGLEIFDVQLRRAIDRLPGVADRFFCAYCWGKVHR